MNIDQAGTTYIPEASITFMAPAVTIVLATRVIFPLLTAHIKNTIDLIFRIDHMTSLDQQVNMLGKYRLEINK